MAVPDVTTSLSAPSGAPTPSTVPAPAVPAPAPENIPRALIGAIFATAILSFLGLLLETVLNVLFPALMSDFGIGMDDVSWMTTGYLLIVSVIMPLSGWLQRRFTARSLFVAAALSVMAGAVIAALAPSYPILLAGRLIQGVGTGIATPLMFTTILMQAPRSKVGSLMGVGALVLGIAPALGPTLGGVVGTVASWRVIFWGVVVLVAVALAIGIRCLTQPLPTVRERLAVDQLVLLAVGLAGLILGIERVASLVGAGAGVGHWSVVAAIALVAMGIAGMAGFVWRARRSDAPLLHLDVFRDRTYRWSLIAFAVLQFGTLGIGYIIPNYAQLALGREAVVAGVIGLPGAVIGAAFAPLGGMILDRMGPRRPIMAGGVIALAGAGMLGVLGLTGHLTIATLVLGNFVYMFGFGLAFANTQTHGMSGIAGRLTADGTAVMNTAQQFFGALSMTILSSIIAAHQIGLTPGTPAYGTGTHDGATIGLLVVAGLVVLALVAEARSFAAPPSIDEGAPAAEFVAEA